VGPPSPVKPEAKALAFDYHEQEYPATVANIQLRRDGKIIISGGFTEVDGLKRRSIAQFNADGTLDLSSPLGMGAPPSAIALQPDDKLLLAGNAVTTTDPFTRQLIRLNADGTIDPTFSSPISDFSGRILLQPDGKILLLSSSVVRLNANGSLDQSFTSLGVPCGLATAAALQSTDRIVVGTAS